MRSQFSYGPVGYKSYPLQTSHVGQRVYVYFSAHVCARGVLVRADTEGPVVVLKLDDGRYVVNGEYQLIALCGDHKDGKPQSDTLAKLSADAMPARTRDLELTERLELAEKRLDTHSHMHKVDDDWATGFNERLVSLETQLSECVKEVRSVGSLATNSPSFDMMKEKIDGVYRAIHEVDEQADKQLRILRGDGGTAFRLIMALDDRIKKLEGLTVRTFDGCPDEHQTLGALADVEVQQAEQRSAVWPQHTADLLKVATDPDVARELASGRYFTPRADVRLKILLQRNHFHAFAEVAIGCVLCEHCGIELEDYQRSMLTSDMRTVCPQVPLSKDNALANLQMWAVRHGHAFAYCSAQKTLACKHCGKRQADYDIVQSCTLDMCPKQPQGDERFVQEKKSP